MSKRTRQQAILEIVSSEKVTSQAALADQLGERGFSVTQATLSRDIAELNLVKSKEGYHRAEDASGRSGVPIPDPVDTLRRLITSVQAAQNQVVVRTPPGSAQQVAIAIENVGYDGVIGTIGGDDTALVIVKTTAAAEQLEGEIRRIIR